MAITILINAVEHQHQQQNLHSSYDYYDCYDCNNWNIDWMERICKWIQRDFGLLGFHPDKQVANGEAAVKKANEWYSLGQSIIGIFRLLIEIYPYTSSSSQLSSLLSSSLSSSSSSFYGNENNNYNDDNNNNNNTNNNGDDWPSMLTTSNGLYSYPCDEKDDYVDIIYNNNNNNKMAKVSGETTKMSRESAKEEKKEVKEFQQSLKIPMVVDSSTSIATTSISNSILAPLGVEQKTSSFAVPPPIMTTSSTIYKLETSDENMNGPFGDILSTLMITLNMEPNVWHRPSTFLSVKDSDKPMARYFFSTMKKIRDESKHSSYATASASARAGDDKFMAFCRRKLWIMCKRSMKCGERVSLSTLSTCLLIKRGETTKTWMFRLNKNI